MGSLVDKALSIVHVAVHGRTASELRLGGVYFRCCQYFHHVLEWQGLLLTLEVKEDEATAALGSAGTGTNDVGKARGIVGKDVVGTSIGQVLRIRKELWSDLVHGEEGDSGGERQLGGAGENIRRKSQ